MSLKVQVNDALQIKPYRYINDKNVMGVNVDTGQFCVWMDWIPTTKSPL